MAKQKDKDKSKQTSHNRSSNKRSSDNNRSIKKPSGSSTPLAPQHGSRIAKPAMSQSERRLARAKATMFANELARLDQAATSSSAIPATNIASVPASDDITALYDSEFLAVFKSSVSASNAAANSGSGPPPPVNMAGLNLGGGPQPSTKVDPLAHLPDFRIRWNDRPFEITPILPRLTECEITADNRDDQPRNGDGDDDGPDNNRPDTNSSEEDNYQDATPHGRGSQPSAGGDNVRQKEPTPTRESPQSLATRWLAAFLSVQMQTVFQKGQVVDWNTLKVAFQALDLWCSQQPDFLRMRVIYSIFQQATPSVPDSYNSLHTLVAEVSLMAGSLTHAMMRSSPPVFAPGSLTQKTLLQEINTHQGNYTSIAQTLQTAFDKGFPSFSSQFRHALGRLFGGTAAEYWEATNGGSEAEDELRAFHEELTAFVKCLLSIAQQMMDLHLLALQIDIAKGSTDIALEAKCQDLSVFASQVAHLDNGLLQFLFTHKVQQFRELCMKPFLWMTVVPHDDCSSASDYSGLWSEPHAALRAALSLNNDPRCPQEAPADELMDWRVAYTSGNWKPECKAERVDEPEESLDDPIVEDGNPDS